MSTLTLELPESLHGRLRALADAQGTSVEGFFLSAAERIVAIEERIAYLSREAALGSREDFERVLALVPDVEPEPHDRLSPENRVEGFPLVPKT